jgi:hypothetical protein
LVTLLFSAFTRSSPGQSSVPRDEPFHVLQFGEQLHGVRVKQFALVGQCKASASCAKAAASNLPPIQRERCAGVEHIQNNPQ